MSHCVINVRSGGGAPVAPSNIQIDSQDIDEGNSINDVIGNLSASGTAPITWALVAGTGDDDNASFNINVAQLRASEVFDFETKSAYTCRVEASNVAGTAELAIAITINDVVEGFDDSILYAYGLTTTDILIRWTPAGEDSVVIERSPQGAGTWSVLESAFVGTEYTDTTAVIDTEYDYRHRNNKAAFDPSAYSNTATAKTLPFVPAVSFEHSGLDHGTNQFGTTTLGTIDQIDNWLGGTSNITPSASGSGINREGSGDLNSVGEMTSIYLMDAAQVFQNTDNGFTVIWDIKSNSLATTNELMGDLTTTASSRFYFDTAAGEADRLIILLAGTNVIINLTGANRILENIRYNCQLTATYTAGSGVLSFSADGGVTVDSTASISPGVFTLEEFQVSIKNTSHYYLFREGLTQSEINEYQNIWEGAAHTVATPSTVIKNLVTPNTLGASGTIVRSDLDYHGLALYLKDRICAINDDIFAILVNKATADDWEDVVIYYDRVNDEYSNDIPISIEGVAPFDRHESGSIGVFDNHMFHLEWSNHYGGGVGDNRAHMVVKKGGKDLNLATEFKGFPMGKGIPSMPIYQGQYPQTLINGSETCTVFHSWDNVSTSSAQFIDMWVSSDSFNWGQKIRICDTDPGGLNNIPEWLYPNLVYSEDGVIWMFININHSDGGDVARFTEVAAIKSTDNGVNWSNVAGTFTKNVIPTTAEPTNLPITLVELRANCLIFDTFATTGNVIVTDAYYDGTTVHGVCVGEDTDGGSPGTDQFHTYFTITGTTLTKFEIDYGGLTMVLPFEFDNQSLIWLVGTDIHTASFEDNSGNWNWVEHMSDDGGATWSFVQTLSNDAGRKFLRPAIAVNSAYSNNIVGACMIERVSPALTGDLFIKTLK